MSLRGKYILASVLLLITLLLALAGGEWREFGAFVSGNADNEVNTIFLHIRLPRVLGAAVSGVLLAAAGCTVQLLFRNPLSSPHVIGSVNAAALGAVGVMALGIHSLWGMFGGSCLGALAALWLLLTLPRSRGGIAVLLLAGVALNAFASAAVSGILFIAGERLEGLIFWLLGGFWKLDWESMILLLTVIALLMPALIAIRREMNMLYLGENAARHAGVDTNRVIFVSVICSALATAAVVGCCGVIGFVGLLVPHIARRIFGSDFALHLAGAGLTGAILMAAADYAARSIFAPLEMPVGVLTSLIGAPFFAVLILRCLKRGASEI